MAKENLNPAEEDEQSKPAEESEPEDASLDELFEEEKEEKEDEKEEEEVDTRIESLEKKIDALQKGISKAFSEQGRKRKEAEKQETGNTVIKSLFFKANPAAELVWDEVEKEAANLGKDPFELYSNSSYFQGEARAKAEAKQREEQDKSKVERPSEIVGEGELSFESIDLKNPEHIKWLKSDPKRIGKFNNWVKSNYKKLRT